MSQWVPFLFFFFGKPIHNARSYVTSGYLFYKPFRVKQMWFRPMLRWIVDSHYWKNNCTAFRKYLTIYFNISSSFSCCSIVKEKSVVAVLVHVNKAYIGAAGYILMDSWTTISTYAIDCAASCSFSWMTDTQLVTSISCNHPDWDVDTSWSTISHYHSHRSACTPQPHALLWQDNN